MYVSDNVAQIENNGVTYVGYNTNNNDKILVEHREYNEWTYILHQTNEFTQTIIGYVIPMQYFSDNEYYKYDYPEKYHTLALQGDTSFVLCTGAYPHKYIQVNSVDDGIKTLINYLGYNDKQIVYDDRYYTENKCNAGLEEQAEPDICDD